MLGATMTFKHERIKFSYCQKKSERKRKDLWSKNPIFTNKFIMPFRPSELFIYFLTLQLYRHHNNNNNFIP